MPTYEYRCPNGHEFEKFFRTISSSESKLPCPECGAVGERIMSAGAGLVFKGSGFYLTDYGKNAHATRGDTRPSAGSDTARDAGTRDSSADSKSAETKSGDSTASAPASSESGGRAGEPGKGSSGGEKKSESGGAKTGATAAESKPAASKPDSKRDTRRDTKSDG
jgi:putative FmdB family regulatory protein